MMKQHVIIEKVWLESRFVIPSPISLGRAWEESQALIPSPITHDGAQEKLIDL